MIIPKHIEGQYKRALFKRLRASANWHRCIDERDLLRPRVALKWARSYQRWDLRVNVILPYL